MLRTSAINIINALGVKAVATCSMPPSRLAEYAVIEVNPQPLVGLASKATGYPIAKVATRIALGYRLDEIKNAVTGKPTPPSSPPWTTASSRFPAGPSTSS